MILSTRKLSYEMPNYSLTGDILSFQRCGLQYRYYSGSSLPPSRPVQLWTGEFIHGIMEESYLYWSQNKQPFPWPCNMTPFPKPSKPLIREPFDIGTLGDTVESKLHAMNKSPRSSLARDFAYKRVSAALNIIAPHLFPLVTAVEKKINGTRQLIPPSTIPAGQSPRCDRYELTGIADVISSINLRKHNNNPIVNLIQSVIQQLHDEFDVIVDYKSSRRPNIYDSEWNYHNWQVQTYAWLRREQPKSIPVNAGVIIYIDELYPSATEISLLKKAIQNNKTDIVPKSGSEDYYALYRWTEGDPLPTFSNEFLLHRALRIIGVSDNEVNNAVSMIDNTVTEIEFCALSENATGNILTNWPKKGSDNDCVACDFRRFCPSTAASRANPSQHKNSPPTAPG